MYVIGTSKRKKSKGNNIKFSLKPFSKGLWGFGGRYVPVGRCSAADRAGRRDQTSRPYRGAGGPGARWAPFRTGLRCHFGRCWASATGRQHPRRQPRPVGPAIPILRKKEGTDVPPLGVPPRPGVLLVEGASTVPPRPLPGLSASQRAPRPLHFFSPAAPV